MATVYYDANILDKAEIHWRNALELKPDFYIESNISLLNFLIEKDIIVNYDGIDSQAYLIRGLVLYQQKEYGSALEFLEKSFDLGSSYFYELDMQIKELKQAIADQNN